MSVQPLLLLPQVKEIVNKFIGEKPSSNRNKVTKIGDVEYFRERFTNGTMMPSLSHIQGEKSEKLITSPPRVSGLADVTKGNLVLFSTCDKGLQHRTLSSVRFPFSAYHVRIAGKSARKGSKIGALLIIMFTQRPSQSRHVFI